MKCLGLIASFKATNSPLPLQNTATQHPLLIGLVSGQTDFRDSKDWVVSGIVTQESSSGVDKILSSELLENSYNRCQTEESQTPCVRAGNLDNGGISSPD